LRHASRRVERHFVTNEMRNTVNLPPFSC